MTSYNQVVLRKWWWLVPVAIAIGIAGGFGALQITQPQYQATCRLFVSVPPGTSPGESYQAAQFGQARVAAYLELIKGERVAEQAINSLNINMAPHDLAGRIAAKADAESVVMDVSVTDGESERSAELANAVCVQFLAVVADAEGPNSPINIRLIESSRAPQAPISPSPKRFLGLGALAGLLVGAGLIMTLAKMRQRDDLRQNEQQVEVAAPELLAPTRSAPDVGEQTSSGSGFHRRTEGPVAGHE